MQIGDRVEAHVDRMSFGGEGIARVDGFVIFVPRAVPGDTVTAKIVSMKKRYASSRIEQILSPSSLRVDPGCPLFNSGGGEHLGCGGCQWLHFDYAEQIKWKRQFVEDAFARIGKLDTEIEPIIGAENRLESRNKLSATVGNNGAVGLCIEHSPTVLPVRSCPMEMRANNDALASFLELYESPDSDSELRSGVNQIHLRAAPDGTVSLCFYTRRRGEKLKNSATRLVSAGAISAVGAMNGKHFTHLAGKRSLRANVGRIEYELPIDTFFQTNYEQATRLLDLVHNGLSPKSGDTLLDLYAGVGFFSLEVATEGVRVTAIEEHPAAIAAAERTARRLKVKGNFLRGRVDPELFASGPLEKQYDLVILDPPRSGCGPDTARAITNLAPRRIVYVSCSPPTLARDIAAMAESGYRLIKCTPIDMFPQTYHVEVVAVLEKS